MLRGTPLFDDKKTPGVRYVAPAAGTVAAIHRGEMRAFQSIVIDVDRDDGPDAQVTFASYPGARPEQRGADAIRALIVESGLWTAFRARPFSRVPAPSSAPHSIFVTAIDTRPHAPSVDVVLAGRMADFHAGLLAVAELCGGKTYVCKAAGSSVTTPRPPTAWSSRNSRGRTLPAPPGCTSTCWILSASARPSGTSDTRTSPPSAGCSPPESSTSSGWSHSPVPARCARVLCARGSARRSMR